MRVRFMFPYGGDLSQEQCSALNATGVQPPLYLNDEGKAASFVHHVGDLERMYAAVPDLRIEVDGAADPHALHDMARSMTRIEALLGARAPGESSSYVNNRVDVHVPGNALLSIEEVIVENDLCTEELSRLMTQDGWRIVAVCPQPDQRRPDYVLGRRRPLLADEQF